jgi:hypothetical protein
MSAPSPESVAREALAAIQTRFPGLRMVEDRDAPVELSVSIPVQEGLKYKVWLGFQNRDELHFSVEHFWLEWFPCSNPSRVAAYVEAVTAFLSGKARVLERYRGAKCVAADLQLSDGAAWHTIGKWSRLAWPFPWKVTTREVRNA